MRFKAIPTLVVILSAVVSHGQQIIGDNYNVTPNGTGFALSTGVNAGINPPTTTRLTGTAAANLRYIATATTKSNSAYSISGNKLRVTTAANPGRFSLSSNGTTAFNFAPALGSTNATPANPVTYDINISMANGDADIQRCSFAIAIAEGDATTWDFGLQIFRTVDEDNFYTIAKRIHTRASGQAASLNMFITNTVPGTYGTELTFLMRVTDAGSETSTYNSRIQLSMDGGYTWFYDTDTDADLPLGWRFNGAGRYILWDVAPDAGTVTYDNFSITPMPLSGKLMSPADNASNIGAAPKLNVLVSNSAAGPVSVTYFGHEAGKPYPGPDFLIPVLPDTQNYAREAAGDGDANRYMWYAQTDWILTNRVRANIAYVAQLGDIVQNGDGSESEWNIATNAMWRLENPNRALLREGVPYGCCVGNHDQDPNGDPDGTTTHYNNYFGSAHYAGKSYYGGHYSSNGDSFYDLFSVGGLDFIVISFEFGRYGSGVLDWATGLLDTYPNRRAIVITHYIGSDSTPSNLSNQGDAIYAALKGYPNFFLMMGGHVFNGGGEGSRSDTFGGHTVRTLVSDYQGRFNGGNGLMRLMYFSPSNNIVNVKTFSPYTGVYETDSDSQFSFSYNMQPNGGGTPGTAYVALGTNSGVLPNTQSSFTWGGRAASKTYEWYAQVTDASGNTFITAPRKFNTGVNGAPIASNVTINVTGDRPTQLTLPASDPNGDGLTYQTNNAPLRGITYGFNSGNGVITYLPAYGYRGLDRVNFQVNDTVANSGVGQVNFNVVAPADSNTNGLPDAWEASYGVTDPNGDADGDGQSNLAEYQANTNPTNAASSLRILSTGFDISHNFTFSWASVGGTRYRVQYANSVSNAVFTDVVRSIDAEMDMSPFGAASTQTYTDTLNGPTNVSRFYRVKVSP